ncbi:hypothetical protein JCM19301_637 [Jejuia pallidilutea]|uniref:Uncharacterized protein n=1 Tax=Jejuia pallidilutea TaxID=504487 RepID=A0A090WEW2_9FLAO|nr:hypothetical protein JCM19301_637 [Jejuia pallidilutea]
MKYITLTIISAIILTSCGGNKNKSVEDIIASQDLEQIRQKKTELDAAAQELSAKLKLLEKEIKSTRSSGKNPSNYNLYS